MFLELLVRDPYVVDVVFGFVTLLSLGLFFFVLELTVSILMPFVDFLGKRFSKKDLLLSLSSLQARRSDLCWELDRVEEEIFDLIKSNKLDNKSEQVFEGLHQV